MGKQEFFNSAVVFAFDIACYYYLGVLANIYFIGGALMGLGLHPISGHFISEHYELNP